MVPVVADFLHRYPEMSAACWFIDRVVNLLEEGVDIGVRIGEPEESFSFLKAIRVGEIPTVVCASPTYLKVNGIPKRPEDLEQHATVGGAAGTVRASGWRFQRRGMPLVVKVQSRLDADGEAAVVAALNGFGLVSALSYEVAEHLRHGRLQPVLADYAPSGQPVHLVQHEGSLASGKTRAFVDMAVTHLRAALRQQLSLAHNAFGPPE